MQQSYDSFRCLVILESEDERAWLRDRMQEMFGGSLEFYEAADRLSAGHMIDRQGFRFQVIICDPLEGDTAHLIELVLALRESHPWLVFLFYTKSKDWQEQRNRRFPAETAKRLGHFYSMDRTKTRESLDDDLYKSLMLCRNTFENYLKSPDVTNPPFLAGDTRYVGRLGQTQVLLSRTEEPWRLECDAFVLPVSKTGEFGFLGRSLTDHLPGGIKDILLEQIQAHVPFEALEPKVLGSFDLNGPHITFIAATPGDSQVNPIEMSTGAMRQCCGLAKENYIETLMLPVVGGGQADWGTEKVLRHFLESGLDESMQLGRIVTPVLDGELFQALVSDPNLFSAAKAKSDSHEEEDEEAPAPALIRGQPPANDRAEGPDLLGIDTEIRALADAIAFKDLKPPLVVGILGGWGTGKSFAMHLLQERLGEVRATDLIEKTVKTKSGEPGGESTEYPYVGHLYRVHFDAWTYAKSNLWASLMHKIFTDLDAQLSLEKQILEIWEQTPDVPKTSGIDLWALLPDASPRRRNALKSKAAGEEILKLASQGKPLEASSLWEQLRARRKEAREEVAQRMRRLADDRHDFETEKQQLLESLDQKVEAGARQAAWKPIAGTLMGTLGVELKKVVDEKLKKQDLEPIPLKEISESIGKWKKCQNRNWVPFIIFALVISLVGYALDHAGWWEHFAGEIGGVLTGIGSLVYCFYNNLAKANQWLADKYAEYEDQVKTERDRIDREQILAGDATLQRKLSSLIEPKDGETAPEPTTLTELEARAEEHFRTREMEIEALQMDVGITARCLSIHEFVRKKLDSRFYDDKLGLLHQVQKDLIELTDALMPPDREPDKELFPRGEPRIFLIIDDLDRCPPDKVVEVLEAVQLLVNTKLFVVILGMDVRYVTRALEKTYREILVRDGDPSGLDYIEKIIQIPYRVPPISEQAMENFLGKQVKLSEKKPEPVEEPVQKRTRGFSKETLGGGFAEEFDDESSETRDETPESMAFSKDLGAFSAAPEPAPPPSPEDVPAEAFDETPGEDLIEAEEQVFEESTVLASVEPVPTRVQEFSHSELGWLTVACNAAEVSPRAGKRLVNVFKLLRVIWNKREQMGYHREEGEETPEEMSERGKVVPAMLMLLSLSAQHPEIMRGLLKSLERACYGGESDVRLKAFLGKCLDEQSNQNTREWKMVHDVILSESFPDLPLDDLGPVNMRLVSSFSFVGEVGRNPLELNHNEDA
ncbi:MAG: P-loop NTPase fold protein [Acidobacteriota bacterium]|nr:P-loop NTPase fold protein [Acidobacteriota bacterium]